MAKSPGERAKEEASAWQGRAWFRDLNMMVHGLWQERSPHTGKPTVTSNQWKFKRLDRHERRMQDHSNIPPAERERNVWEEDPWLSVDNIFLIGMIYDERERVIMEAHLDTLRLQVAQLMDFHEDNLFERMIAADIPATSLGRFGSPLGDLVLDGEHKRNIWGA